MFALLNWLKGVFGSFGQSNMHRRLNFCSDQPGRNQMYQRVRVRKLRISWEVTVQIYISAVIQMVHHYSMFFRNLWELLNQIRTSILWVHVGKISQVNDFQKVTLSFLKIIWTKILQYSSAYCEICVLKVSFSLEKINLLFLKIIWCDILLIRFLANFKFWGTSFFSFQLWTYEHF